MMRTALAGRAAALTVAFSLAVAAVGAQSPLGTSPFESYLEALRQQAGIPGLSAAIVQNGEVVWERGFGFQNVEARIRATPDTPYPIADLSSTAGSRAACSSASNSGGSCSTFQRPNTASRCQRRGRPSAQILNHTLGRAARARSSATTRIGSRNWRA